MNLIKSKQRIADHGEVFTPPWLVEAMLDLVKGESERIDSRFLEPACGDGNFLVPVLLRKLVTVDAKYGESEFLRGCYSLLALMCIYGIEILADNVAECRARLLTTFAVQLNLEPDSVLYRAAGYVLSQNIIHGDAMRMVTVEGRPLKVAEWGYLGKGKFKRRDFRLSVLVQPEIYTDEDSLFGGTQNHDVYIPARDYPSMSIRQLASLAQISSVNPK